MAIFYLWHFVGIRYGYRSTASVPAYFYNDPWACQVKIIDIKLTEAITTSTLGRVPNLEK